ncbi:MAG: twitching motility protein PilT [Bradymonadia bacterium]|jgi:twitching motility protein PilT
MNSKDILRTFKEARFADSSDVENWVLAVTPINAADAQACFLILQDRRFAQDARVHKFRCALLKRLLARTAEYDEYNLALRELFIPLLRSARGADEAVREFLIEVLPLVNNVSGHRELVLLFKHTDPGIRAFAKTVCEKVGGKTVFSLLVELCGQPDFPGRMEALDACVRMAGYHAIPALKNVISAGVTDEKLSALKMLGDPELVSKNRQGALEAILVATEDINDDVSMSAVGAFGSVAEEDDFFRYIVPRLENANIRLICTIVRATLCFRSSRTLGMLKEQLLLGPKTVRLAVLDSLEAMAHEDVLPVVAEALNHKQIEVRLRAAKVLENLATRGSIDVARTIVWLLRSRDVDVKRIAADLARRVGDPEGKLWPQLFRFLRDEDWWVRERITDALVELAGLELTRHVVGLLQDESPVVRRYSVDMLMKLEDPNSLGALVRVVQADDDWWVRERAVEAIGALGDNRAVPYIVDFLHKEEDLELICIDVLAELGDKRAAPHVAQYLDEADLDLTLVVFDCLEALNDHEQASAIMPFTENLDHRVRSRARAIIRRWHLDAQFNDWEGDEAGNMGTLDRLLWAMVRAGGDDLLVAAGRRPYIKRMGEVNPLVKNVFTDEQMRGLLYPHMSTNQIADLEQRGADVDFSYEVTAAGLRFRANVFRERGGLAAVFRVVRNQIPAMEELGLPPIVHTFGDLKNGLVLVGGPTGSGKSTTLAAIIDYINRTYAKHIITLEDPIEVIHETKKSLINQRELGTHSSDFRSALRSTLREDPDVILVGEMRDIETISFAISAAETGHLVFGTVHTTTADTSVDRIINAFPIGQQPQVRTILASSLRSVICQYLVPRKDGRGRVPAVEVMVNSDAIANLVRKGKTYQIANVVATSRELGMQSMDNDLTRLYKEGIISSEEGYMRAVNKNDFEAVVVENESGSPRTVKLLTSQHKAIGGDNG